MALEVISINSDNLVRLDVLTNASTGAYVNNAVVSFTCVDASGNTVQGSTAMANVNTSGRYEGTLTNGNTASMTDGALYTITITAAWGAPAVQLTRTLSCVAKKRSAF